MPDEFQSPESDQQREHRLELPAELAGLRLDQALTRLLPQYSRSRIQTWIDAGRVLIDGRAPRGSERVLGGERAIVRAEFPPERRIAAERIALAIVHADRALFVIDKPAGLIVHPGAGNPRHTLQNALLAHDPKLAHVPRAGIVHRLDKDTSGLLIIARTPEAHTALVAALAAREIHREYLAVCVGAMTGGGTIAEPIGRHRTQRTRMAVRSDGREALTHYRIEQRFRAHTLVRVELGTGRTHQIRVHLAHAGYPLLADAVYGGRRRIPAGASAALLAALEAFKRQALHAARLRFAHPVSGKALEFAAPLPADLQAVVTALSRDAREHARGGGA